MAHALPYVAFSCPLMQDRLHFDGQAPPVLAILPGGRLVASHQQRHPRLARLDRCIARHTRAVPMRCRGAAGKFAHCPTRATQGGML